MNPADSRTPVAAQRADFTRGRPQPNYYNIEHDRRFPAQPAYTNTSTSPSHSQLPPSGGLSSTPQSHLATPGGLSSTPNSRLATPSGLSSTYSTEVRSVSPSLSSHGSGGERMKQIEQEIHLLRMSVNDKDAQLSQVQRDLSYSNDQVKQLNVLLSEKKETILTYQERISDMQSEIGNLREASVQGMGQPLPDVRAAQQAIEALRLQMTQLRAQLAEVNRQNTQLRSQNRDLLWELQQVKQHKQQPLRASSADGSEEIHRQTSALRDQHTEAVRENTILRSRVELLTHQVTTYNEDFRAERSDRERAQATIQEKKEEIAGLKQMIVLLARDHGIQLDVYGLGNLPQEVQQ